MNAELLRFLAHALEVEADAMTRYEELADALQVHNNPEAAAFFAGMAIESARHLADVEERVAGRDLPEIPPWEFDWHGDAPESADYEALHYRMGPREALLLALANERSAAAFYEGYAESAEDPETVALAQQFADEERDHARRLEERLAETPTQSDLQRQDDDAPHLPE